LRSGAEVGEPARHGGARPHRLDRLAVDLDGPAVARRRAEQRAEDRLPTGAGDAGNADDVACPDVEVEPPHGARVEGADSEHRPPGLALLRF